MLLSDIASRLFKPSLDEEAFFRALDSRDVKYVSKILAHYPAVANRLDPQGRSPLNIAADSRNFELCKLLVDAGANLEHLDPRMQMQPLNRALHTADAEIAELLIDKGADVNARDGNGSNGGPDGQTPIYMAAGGGPFRNVPVTTMQKLVKKGADVNVLCNDTTPLMLAAMADNKEAIKFLLKSGADMGIRKKSNGVTADQLARSTEMQDYLSQEKKKYDALEVARENARRNIAAIREKELAAIMAQRAETEEIAKLTEGTRQAIAVQRPLRFRPHQ